MPLRALMVLLFVLAATALVSSAPVARAQTAPLRAEIVGVTEGEYPEATAVVDLQDTSGAGVDGLTADNITVTVGGRQATVRTVSLASSSKLALDLVLVIDTSGSMSGEPLAQAKEAAKGLIATLAPGDRVAIINFSDVLHVPQEFTTDRAAASAVIDSLVARGQTGLYEATAAAAVMAGTSTSARRAVILLSDGAQEGVQTDETATSAIAAARDAGVPFFTIGEGTSIDTAYLTQLAEESRGRYLEAPAPADLSGLFDNLAQLLRSQYVVTFDASGAAGSPESTVTVRVNAGGRTATASATFRPSAVFAPPAIFISGVQAGEALTEARDVTVTAADGAAISRVAYLVDGVDQFETATPPFTFRYDPKDYPGGSHTLRASVQVGALTVEAAPVSFTSTPPVSEPAAPESPGGSPVPITYIGLAIAGLVALAAAWAAAVAISRRLRTPDLKMVAPGQRVTPWATARHRPVSDTPPIDSIDEAEDSGPAPEIGEALGVLISRAGSDIGAEYAVGARPVSIGYGASCAVRIDDPALATEEARIWVRGGRLAVHRMTRLTVIASQGASGGWQFFEAGDTFEIGAHRFEFRLLPQPAADEERDDGPATAETVLRERTRAAPPAASAGPAPTLLEMMPDDLGFTDTEEQAS